MRTLVWFRGKDLRLSDREPLRDAIEAGETILLFVLDPYFFAPKRARELPHRIQFLLDSLTTLCDRIERLGSRLFIVAGKSVDIVPKLASKWRVDRVVAHRWTEPFGRERDQRIAATIDVPFVLYEGETLSTPGSLRSGAAKPYAVFTPYSRAFDRGVRIAIPRPEPRRLPPPPKGISARTARIPDCAALGIARNARILPGGERAARARLRGFLKGAANSYHRNRDQLGLVGTSRLSADLKFGTFSVRTVWHETIRALPKSRARETLLRQLVWRDFSYSTLWDRPTLLAEPFRAEFDRFPWRFNAQRWKAWVEGQTGYPVVDASARQLLTEGFVHNRARMISASFLTKHLMISYRDGEAHYLKYLTDGDWAQNNAGWQWSAGCGCDAQPYFRVFNPVTQGQRYDSDGSYVRRHVPELARLPTKYIHAPWTAPTEILRDADVSLGQDYPKPIVDHKEARERFLRIARRYLNAGKNMKGAQS
jgi:deoxyribodipyrimidine photo-lyase